MFDDVESYYQELFLKHLLCEKSDIDLERIIKFLRMFEYDEETKKACYERGFIYEEEFFAEAENCSAVVKFILEVEDAVGLDNLNVLDLVLYPNPVGVGEAIYIGGELAQEELSGMQIEVYSILGQLVTQFTPTTQPIVVDGLFERGVYIVRATFANGTIYKGKIVVN